MTSRPSAGTNRPYYYVIDRMFNVRAIIDRAGAIIERYAYDDYGRPLIRESCGRGDMNQDTLMNGTDDTRFAAAKAASIWDPRADMDDDGDVDSADQSIYDTKRPDWNNVSCDGSGLTVAQAFSDVGNWYMFQGVPHLALDTKGSDTEGKLMLNHHRNRWVPPHEGTWVSRDPLIYNGSTLLGRTRTRHLAARRLQRLLADIYAPQLFVYLDQQPLRRRDQNGTTTGGGEYGSYACYPDGNNEDGTGPAEIQTNSATPGSCQHECVDTHEGEHRSYGYPTCFAFWLFRSDPYYSYAAGCLDTAYQIWGILHERDDECSAASVSAGCSCIDPTCSCPENGIDSPICLASLENIAANCPNGAPATFPPPSPPWDSILTCIEH